MSQKGGVLDKFMPILYGIGAAIVIVGAMFKIMHWPGAGPMLVVGLSTEAVIFAFSAFQPVPHDPDWAKVYPQLRDDYDGDVDAPSNSGDVVGKLGDMMKDANINQGTISKLGQGLTSLTDSVSKIGDITNASVASNEYATVVKSATGTMKEMNTAYATAAKAMSGMSDAAVDAQKYHEQVQSITKNLGALNAVYEMELQDANNHLRAMNKFYGNLSNAMENMAEATKDTQAFKEELTKLSRNLTSLNNVYGNMLNAMKG